MKKVYCLLAAALTLGACSQEDLQLQNDANVQTENNSSETLIVKAVKSRMAVENGYQLNWTKGDTIQGFDAIGSYNLYELTQPVELGTNAEFKKVSGLQDTEVSKAIFPYNEKNVVAENTLVVNVLSTYNTQERAASLPVIGDVADGVVDFGFAPSFMGMLNMNLTAMPEGYNSIKIYASAPISHSFNVTGDGFDGYVGTPVLEDIDSKTEKPKASSAQRTIRINNITNKAAIYVPVPAATYGDITVTASNGQKEIQVLTFLNAKIEANTIYTVTYEQPVSIIPAIPETLEPVSSHVALQQGRKYTWKCVLSKPDERKASITVENGMIKLDYPDTDNSPYNLSAACLIKAPEQPSKAYRITFKWKGNNSGHLASFAVPTGGYLYPYAKYLSNIPEIFSNGLPSQNEWWDNALATTTNPEDYEKWHTVNTYVVSGYYTKQNRTTGKHTDYVVMDPSQMGDFTIGFWMNGKGTYYIKDVEISPVR